MNGKLVKIKSESGELIISKKIESVVTKEQFKEMEYRVDE